MDLQSKIKDAMDKAGVDENTIKAGVSQLKEKAEKGELDSVVDGAQELAGKVGVNEETAKKAGDFVKEKLKQMN